MTRPIALTIFIVIVVATDSCRSQGALHLQREAAGLALVGATVIDVRDGTRLSNATVLIADGKISHVGPTGDVPVPTDVRKVDLSIELQILAFYQQRGHYLAEVDAQADYENGTVVYVVREGRAVHVGAVRFRGFIFFGESWLRERLSTRVGADEPQLLRAQELESDRRRIESWYRDEGFTQVEVAQPEVWTESGSGGAEVTFGVREGPRTLLRYLGVNSGDMEKGVIRFEANVSVRPVGSNELFTRTEIKASGSQPTNLMKFTGEYLDPTGLYYLRARQYDPVSGRFLTTDPAKTVDSDAMGHAGLLSSGAGGDELVIASGVDHRHERLRARRRLKRLGRHDHVDGRFHRDDGRLAPRDLDQGGGQLRRVMA